MENTGVQRKYRLIQRVSFGLVQIRVSGVITAKNGNCLAEMRDCHTITLPVLLLVPMESSGSAPKKEPYDLKMAISIIGIHGYISANNRMHSG